MVYTAAERENRRMNAQEKYRQAAAKEAELREYNRERQKQLRDEYEKLRSSILQDISNVVTEKCLAEGYGLVLDKSGRSLNNTYMQARTLTQEFIDDWLGYFINPANKHMSSLLLGSGLPGGMMGSMMADLGPIQKMINKEREKKGEINYQIRRVRNAS